MDMDGLHSFIAVAREKSISKAAQALHVTQPTLSARLRKLEEGLGVKLLDRGWDGIRLTKEGRFFLSYSVDLFQQIEEAAAILSQDGGGGILERPLEAIANEKRLRIGIESFYYPAFLPSVIEGVRSVVPNAECLFANKTSDLLTGMVDCESLDFCVNFNYIGDLHPCSRLVHYDKGVLLYPKEGYPDIRTDLSNAPLLADRPFILFDNSPLRQYSEVTERVFHYLLGRVPERFHIVNDFTVMADMLRRGFGYTFMPRSSLLHMMDAPLPFHAIEMEAEFLISPVFITYAQNPSSHHPIERIAKAVTERLKTAIDAAFQGKQAYGYRRKGD
ncbi:LysR family transcriptional regulator [Cohnella sp. GbtcB17]|uniref:LysR family transcriptional regulator n=1 Tax=Cohnella sp. GbtcB17 TaxID=2824762 RepID=UPI001C2F2EC7|nr:LysR family transcriptional regulator [Cohnella sp. GbtcB17]